MTSTPSYLVRPEAERDLREIGRYTRRAWGRDQARKYLRALHRMMQRLAANPRLGAMRDDIGEGYRRAHVGHHLVFYRTVGDDVVVVRVLHESMDVQQHLDVTREGSNRGPSSASPESKRRKR